jgi:hypothetical protein
MDLGDLAGHQLTSELLNEMRRRSAEVTPARVLRRFAEDRFSRTAAVDPAVLRRVESALAAHWPEGTEELQLAPVAPFGTHAAIADVDQNRVVSTVRGSEVAADPTVVLALEASRRRSAAIARDARDASVVSLAAFQRVTRAQRFDGEMSFAHFHLSGLVTAGRDTGGRAFERQAMAAHISSMVDGLTALGCSGIQVRVTDFDGGFSDVVEELTSRRWRTGVRVVPFPERTRAGRYYTDLAIEVHVEIGGSWIEVGDGGTVDWTQRLVQSKKERAMTSGLGVERLALVLDDAAG